jgi:F0F1-type ATP synthase assembly protein I
MRDVPKRSGSSSAEAGQYLSTGLTAALSILLFLWLGTLGDRWLGTEPWLTLLSVFVGAAAGFYHMYHRLVVAPRGRQEMKRDE